MYKELGGYVGYMLTPKRELQEMRLSIIAETNIQAEKDNELALKQEEHEREMQRMKLLRGQR